MSDYDDLMLQVAALKVLSDFTKNMYDDARGRAAEVMGDGDKRVVRSPLDGSKIGPVSKSDPPVHSVVTDEEALAEWMDKHYPEHVESGYKVLAGDAELISVLFVHAPHLLKKTRRVKRSVLMDVHEKSVAAGEPMGPGFEMDVPGIKLQRNEPVVSCRPDPDSALLAVMELVHNHKMMIDGTMPKEIEA